MPALVLGQSAYVPPPPWAVGGGAVQAPKPAPSPKVVPAKAPAATGIPSGQQDCRFCHEFSASEIDLQPKLAQKKHRRALEQEKACDSCHDAEEMCCHELVFAQLEAAEDEDDD